MVNFYDKYIVCGNDSSTATLSDVAGRPMYFTDQYSYSLFPRCIISEKLSKMCKVLSLSMHGPLLFVDHIDYIKNQIGVDYVGIGADYDGVPT